MRPANFPERKNQRRRDALIRMQTTTSNIPEKMERKKICYENTNKKCVPSAIGVKTKKTGRRDGKAARLLAK